MSKFKFGDRIVFVEGFNKGQHGFIVEARDEKLKIHTSLNELGWFDENQIRLMEHNPNIPTVEETAGPLKTEDNQHKVDLMNKRKCKADYYEHHINEYLDGVYFGRYKFQGVRYWIGTHWLVNGKNDTKEGLDLIEQPPKEWHEDVIGFRNLYGRADYLTEATFLDKTDHWRERRYYKEVNGKTEFIRSEVIKDDGIPEGKED